MKAWNTGKIYHTFIASFSDSQISVLIVTMRLSTLNDRNLQFKTESFVSHSIDYLPIELNKYFQAVCVLGCIYTIRSCPIKTGADRFQPLLCFEFSSQLKPVDKGLRISLSGRHTHCSLDTKKSLWTITNITIGNSNSQVEGQSPGHGMPGWLPYRCRGTGRGRVIWVWLIKQGIWLKLQLNSINIYWELYLTF